SIGAIPASKSRCSKSLLLHTSAQLLKDTETSSKSRSQGGREVDDDDGEDDNIHSAYVATQHSELTSQMAINKATDTSNPNVMSTRLTVPVGKSNGPSNKVTKNYKRAMIAKTQPLSKRDKEQLRNPK
ncbi:hypothetical protein PAXRUDRAFT_169443, partial [Paxillus rubicundulus Ve08.2h10]